MTSVLWFRRDLRLHDLPALSAALERGPVVPLFVLDDRLLRGRWASPNRTAFMLECLSELDASLRERGSLLHIRRGDPRGVVPQFAAQAGATDVFVSRDYTPYARQRDTAVARQLAEDGIGFRSMPGTLIHEPEDVVAGSGHPYSMFTPFFRRWREVPLPTLVAAPSKIDSIRVGEAGTLPALAGLGIAAPSAQILAGGESEALGRLDNWAGGGLAGYEAKRDALGLQATSRLSQDLRWGTLSPRQAAWSAIRSGLDPSKFLAELAWRDFYAHVLWHYPNVLREPFRKEFSRIEWENDAAKLEAWRSGRTGFPLVDAAMRQLLATGFMHNRARMIVASFLAKDLHIDWRLGETHFMRHLVDGDVASNNGGWQWAASTGTDSQPYFRIFNPLLQSKRFDPDGTYIRRWVPELARVATKFVHEPAKMPMVAQLAAECVVGRDYPAPIVDHAAARVESLALYAAARDEAKRSG